MGLNLIPKDIASRYQFDERGHACAILRTDFRSEFNDVMECLRTFVLRRSDVLTPGGNKSPIARGIDGFLHQRGWSEKWFDTKIVVDAAEWPTPTHSIDNFKNRVGFETEWNNKDPFFDRDLSNFRLLHQLNVLSVGIVLTRLWELQKEFKRLGKGSSYGMNTTHWDQLIPRVNGGAAGGCPLLLVGMGMACYDPNA